MSLNLGDLIPGLLGDNAARIRIAGGAETLRTQVEDAASRLGVQVPFLAGLLGKAASAADQRANEEAKKAALDEGPGFLSRAAGAVSLPVVLIAGLGLAVLGYLVFFFKPRKGG